MIVAIIPARGGSQRIPRKNIRAFHGRPMIAWPISAALAAKSIDRVLVSTDDEEIASVARAQGAEVPFFRPATLADAHTGTQAVIQHALAWLRKQDELPPYVCCLYATAPFVTEDILDAGYARLLESKREFCFSVGRYASPIQRALRCRADGSVDMLHPETMNTRSQDLEECFFDAGQFYWGKSQAFLDDVPLFSAASIPHVLPGYRVQDIDTEDDWRRAEMMFAALLNTEPRS